MRLTPIILMLCASLAQAEIYKTYDKNGNVVFTDVPSSDAQQVENKPIATVPALPRSVIEAKTKPLTDKKASTVPSDYQISITGLTDQATLRKESDAMSASIQLKPALHKDHYFVVLLDGQSIGKDIFAPTIDPKKLERGQHRLEVQVMNKQRNILQSQRIDFFVQQTTVNKPKTK